MVIDIVTRTGKATDGVGLALADVGVDAALTALWDAGEYELAGGMELPASLADRPRETLTQAPAAAASSKSPPSRENVFRLRLCRAEALSGCVTSPSPFALATPTSVATLLGSMPMRDEELGEEFGAAVANCGDVAVAAPRAGRNVSCVTFGIGKSAASGAASRPSGV